MWIANNCLYFSFSLSNQSIPRGSMPRYETMVISRKKAQTHNEYFTEVY